MRDASARPDIAVLLMAHGTPRSLDELPEYLRLVTGREPSARLLEEMRQSYGAVGGRSPLTDITLAQAAALGLLLDSRGVRALVVAGMRNWRPFIREAAAEIAESGVTRVVGIPMSPQFSTASVRRYVEAASAALPARVNFTTVEAYCEHPLLVEAFAERVNAAAAQPGEEVVFTAHSLPERDRDAGDPYPEQVAATTRAVAARCGLRAYAFAYQSAGRAPGPWLGPDIGDLIRERAAAGVRALLAVPIGFVCDHTEVLYDLDIKAASVARECGVTLRRTESLNTSPAFIRMLAALVESALAAGSRQ